MVNESQLNTAKWSVFALAAMAIISGVILNYYGLTRVFQINPETAKNEGLAGNDALGPFLDCNSIARSRPAANATGQAGALEKLYTDQCLSKQAPFIYLWALTASLTLFTIPFTAWAIHKETRGPILLSAIWLAVVLALGFMSLYAYLHAIPNQNRLVNCDRLGPEESAELEKQNLGHCAQHSEATSDWQRYRRCLLSGIILSLLGAALLSWLLPYIFHFSRVRVVLPTAVKEDFAQRTMRGTSETVQATSIAPQYSQQQAGPAYV